MKNGNRKPLHRVLAVLLTVCLAAALAGFTGPAPAVNSKYILTELLRYDGESALQSRVVWDTEGNPLSYSEYSGNRIVSHTVWVYDASVNTVCSPVQYASFYGLQALGAGILYGQPELNCIDCAGGAGRPVAKFVYTFSAEAETEPEKYETEPDYASAEHMDSTYYYYDLAGKLIREDISHDAGSPESTVYEYDADGNCVARVLPDGSRYSYDYDADGNLAAERDPDGVRREFDAAGNRTLLQTVDGIRYESEYDADGNLVHSAETNEEGFYISMYSAQYDDGLLTVEISSVAEAPEAKYDIYFAEPVITSYEYDTKGNPLSATDAGGNATEFSYNSSGLLVSEISYDAERTELSGIKYAYDSHSRLVSMVNTVAGTDESRYTYSYDSNGNLTGAELLYPGDEAPACRIECGYTKIG